MATAVGAALLAAMDAGGVEASWAVVDGLAVGEAMDVVLAAEVEIDEEARAGDS